MQYGHLIKCRYYFDGIFIYTELGSISDVNIEKIFEILRNI